MICYYHCIQNLSYDISILPLLDSVVNNTGLDGGRKLASSCQESRNSQIRITSLANHFLFIKSQDDLFPRALETH